MKFLSAKLAKRWTAVLAMVVASGVIAGGVIAASSLIFPALSDNHLRYGVSAFWAGPVGELNAPRYSNPTPINMIVASLFYNIVLIDDETDLTNPGTEEYKGCMVVELTPHASIYVDDVADFVDEGNSPYYSEVIAAPRDKQRAGSGWMSIFTRKLDKVGILSLGGTKQSSTVPVHPDLFTLPSDDVVLGQRQEATDCICDGLFDLEADLTTLWGFGVLCGD